RSVLRAEKGRRPPDLFDRHLGRRRPSDFSRRGQFGLAGVAGRKIRPRLGPRKSADSLSDRRQRQTSGGYGSPPRGREPSGLGLDRTLSLSREGHENLPPGNLDRTQGALEGNRSD